MAIRPDEALVFAGAAYDKIVDPVTHLTPGAFEAIDDVSHAMALWFTSGGESPIEAALLYELVKGWGAPRPGTWVGDAAFTELGLEPRASIAMRLPWCLWDQLKIGRYSVDFALASPVGQIVVECDGHAFHERTKEQVARDKKRDRFLVSEGWSVLRFSGSEIYRDSEACASDVIRLMRKMEKGMR